MIADDDPDYVRGLEMLKESQAINAAQKTPAPTQAAPSATPDIPTMVVKPNAIDPDMVRAAQMVEKSKAAIAAQAQPSTTTFWNHSPTDVDPLTGKTYGENDLNPQLRKWLEPDPSLKYADVLPFATDAQGNNHWALPQSARNMLTGALDMAEGPTRGTVTPQATQFLASLAVGKKPSSALSQVEMSPSALGSDLIGGGSTTVGSKIAAENYFARAKAAAEAGEPAPTNSKQWDWDWQKAEYFSRQAADALKTGSETDFTPQMRQVLNNMGKTPAEIAALKPKDAYALIKDQAKSTAQDLNQIENPPSDPKAPNFIQRTIENALQHKATGVLAGGASYLFGGGVPAALGSYVLGNAFEPAIKGAIGMGGRAIAGTGKAAINALNPFDNRNPTWLGYNSARPELLGGNPLQGADGNEIDGRPIPNLRYQVH